MIIIVCHPLQHSTVKLSVLCWSQCPAWPGMLRAHCHATTARTHTLPASQSVVWRSWSQAPAALQHNIEKYLKSTNKGGDTWPKTTSYSVHHLLQPQEQCQVGLTIVISSKYAKFWRNHKRITCLISEERWPFYFIWLWFFYLLLLLCVCENMLKVLRDLAADSSCDVNRNVCAKTLNHQHFIVQIQVWRDTSI